MEGKYVKIKEQNLIKQLKKKNPQAIDYIIDQYGGLIKTVLLKNLYDQKDHWEECFNDCLLAVWNHPERFDTKKGDFKPAPLTPFTRFSHVSATVLPTGVSAPRPVTTTLFNSIL